MGKEKIEPYVENNKELKIAKMLTIGASLDERIADGLYMGKTLKLIEDIMSNPDTLLDSLPDDGSIPKKFVKRRAKKASKVKSKKVKKEKKSKKISYILKTASAVKPNKFLKISGTAIVNISTITAIINKTRNNILSGFPKKFTIA